MRVATSDTAAVLVPARPVTDGGRIAPVREGSQLLRANPHKARMQ
jgi:hypothetical protein